MTIAFYAPMKSPDHPVPSGDRQMARLLVRTLEVAGYQAVLASHFRVYLKDGDQQLPRLQEEAGEEIARLLSHYESNPGEGPRLWFTYHPYYKSPDLIGPEVSSRLGIPYVTAEGSWSRKRVAGAWAQSHALNEKGLCNGALHLCFTQRDKAGLEEFLGSTDTLVDFPPFIDLAGVAANATRAPNPDEPVRLLTVAMMRADVKLQSYRMLAQALTSLQDADWHLDIVGDGVARADVEAAFADVDPNRLTWHGELASDALRSLYDASDLYVWPGFGEAFGMAFLEAQAAGLPVVAQDTKGIPSVVLENETGFLTPLDDVDAFRMAVRRLIDDSQLRSRMSVRARGFVWNERSLEKAAGRLKTLLGALL